MRLLHVADVHLQHSFVGLTPGRGRERRQELLDSLARVVDVAREQRVDALCIAGDLFERENTPPVVGDRLRATFARLGETPVLIAPGNRDFYTAGCLFDAVRWTPNVSIFREPTLSPVEIANGTVWGTAFRTAERHYSPLLGFQVSPDSLDVALLHADVVDENESSAYAPIRPSEIAASGVQLAMLGHVHAGRIDEARQFAYPGSLEPLSARERGPRWALLVDVNRSGSTIQKIPIAARRALAEEIDLSAIDSLPELRRLAQERAADWGNADVELTLVGTRRGELANPERVVQVWTDAHPDLALRLATQTDEDLASLASQPTALGIFIRLLQGKLSEAADDATRQRWEAALAAGLAAFRNHLVSLS
jgi:DNA repair exonuclease SbcCD nuclease subunit